MTQQHPTVEQYLAALPADQATRAGEVIERVRSAAPGAVETISYGMPTFTLGNGHPIYVAAWKKHLALHDIARLDADLESELAPYRSGQDTLKFPYRNPIPLDLITRIVVALAAMRVER
jgi:uncharacterized protein YdhG (YjbR/CyaY superfamily)